MAAARQPLVGRASVAENIIKQGYLKKSVRSSDPILSTPQQLATNIKQKLEPSRWYVFGVRYGHPYLEFFESEEKVFTNRPVEFNDLTSYRNLTYTLGKTNTTYTFCIFLEESTIELTAQNRAQMLDWCRTLERHLRNLGIGNKRAKEDHMYSAFPVPPKPPTKNSLEYLEGLEGLEGATALDPEDNIEENIYEEADDVKDLRKDKNHNDPSSPALPPRPRKSNEDEDVFASIYSVQKLPDNDYFNCSNSEPLLYDVANNESEVGTLIAPERKLGPNHLNGNLGRSCVNDFPEEDDGDRCTSLPEFRSTNQEYDTSEDSDFLSASFWLRNRKQEDLISFDDTDLETARRKHSSSSINNDPPLPMRSQSVRNSDRRRNCMSMYSNAVDIDIDVGLFPEVVNSKPVPMPRKSSPKPRQSPVVEDEKDSVNNSLFSALPLATGDFLKSPVSSGNTLESDTFVKNGGDGKWLKAKDKCDKRDELSAEAEDEGAYEALVNTATPHRPVQADEDTLYETSWVSPTKGDSAGKCKANVDDTMLKESKTKIQEKDTDMPIAPPKRMGISKMFKRSSKNKALPEALFVSLPARNACKDRSKASGKDCGRTDSEEEEEEDYTQMDGNLYTDLPDGKANGYPESGVAKNKIVESDSTALKISSKNDTKCAKQNSPVLPKRNLSSSVTETRKVPAEYVLTPFNLSKSMCETQPKCYSAAAGTDLYDSCNGSVLPPSPTDKSHVQPDSPTYQVPSSLPVAPPRRNRATVQDSSVTYSSPQGKHKTVISNTNKPTSYELAATLPIGEKLVSNMVPGGEDPPLPPRLDSLPGRQGQGSPTKTGKQNKQVLPPRPIASLPERSAHETSLRVALPDRPAPPPPSLSGLPERPAPPPPLILGLPERPAPPPPARNSPTERPPLPLPGDCPTDRPAPPPPLVRRKISRTQSDDRPEAQAPPPGPRPRTAYMVARQPSQLGMNLKQQQVDTLKAERDSTGGMVRSIPRVHFQNGLALVQCFDRIWIAGWDVKKYPRLYDKFHIGDELITVNDVQLVDLPFAYKLVKNIKADTLEVTVRRLPNAQTFAIQRSQEGESLGLKREGGTAEIVYVDPNGLAAKHGLSSKANTMSGGGVCNWTLTEINMRPLNPFFKDNEIEHRLLAVGRDISIVVQPSDFIKELKKQLKKIRGFKDFIVQ